MLSIKFILENCTINGQLYAVAIHNNYTPLEKITDAFLIAIAHIAKVGNFRDNGSMTMSKTMLQQWYFRVRLEGIY